jgi:signal transduction histidine kinase
MNSAESSADFKFSGAGCTEAPNRRARRAQLVGQLAGGIAHDFNNIFTALIAMLDLVAGAVAERPEVAAGVRLADETAIRGIGLASDLLAIARGAPGLPSNIDVNIRLADAARLLRPVLGKQIELDLVTAAGAATAFADGIALMTAIFYIAVNARDAMTEGGRLTIEAASHAPAQQSRGAAVTPGHVLITITLKVPQIRARDPAELLPDLDAARDCIAPFGGSIEILDEPGDRISIGVRLRS